MKKTCVHIRVLIFECANSTLTLFKMSWDVHQTGEQKQLHRNEEKSGNIYVLLLFLHVMLCYALDTLLSSNLALKWMAFGW